METGQGNEREEERKEPGGHLRAFGLEDEGTLFAFPALSLSPQRGRQLCV